MPSAKFATILISICVLLTSIAQLLFRLAMKSASLSGGVDLTFFTSLISASSSTDLFILLAGLFAYSVSMLVWILALTRYPVSFAYPLLSMSYILVYLLATRIPALDEQPSIVQFAGVGLIVIGVSVLSLAKPADADRSSNYLD